MQKQGNILIVGGNSQDAKYVKRLYEINNESDDESPKGLPISITTGGKRLNLKSLERATSFKPSIMYYFHAVSNPRFAELNSVETYQINYEDFMKACETYWRIVPDGKVFYPCSVLQFRAENGIRDCNLDNLDFGNGHPYIRSKNMSYLFVNEMAAKGKNIKCAFLSRHDSKYRNNFIVSGICREAVQSFLSKTPAYFNFDKAFEKVNRGFAGDYATMIVDYMHSELPNNLVMNTPGNFVSLKDIVDAVEEILPGCKINYTTTDAFCEVAEQYSGLTYASCRPDFTYANYKDVLKEILQEHLSKIYVVPSNQDSDHLRYKGTEALVSG